MLHMRSHPFNFAFIAGFDFENPAARIRLAVDQLRGVAQRVVNRNNLTATGA
jgi:hypothetical protein